MFIYRVDFTLFKTKLNKEFRPKPNLLMAQIAMPPHSGRVHVVLNQQKHLLWLTEGHPKIRSVSIYN